MSAPRPTLDELLERNKVVAQTHKAPPQFSHLPKEAKPRPDILVVTCADPRCDPAYFFATRPGEMVVLRNLGGRVEAIMPDILALDVLAEFKHIYVIHHTDCTAIWMSEDAIREELRKVPGADPKAIDALPLSTWADDEKSVRDDLKFLRDSSLLRKDLAASTHGLLLDIATGLLKTVV
ncbi:carbonic anhydrase [Coniochaeta ligniaria NRRL 30616]|uniref:Carbonic anhydrase n=1 Tax=Coniochaeta ligniaria NRRL 30616 TaxID=1408157 RepID=A0A1J7JMY5_9PEZI|nr:carbonic anhydrase [Coniochaeta ligniaria NRRL 30616]